MRKRHEELIADNLESFQRNFGDVRIETFDDVGFYVYYPPNADSYIQYCYSIEYLDGWLYGCVQGINRREFREGKIN